MDKIIKITLSLLLFICLADMPYGYYQLVRYTAVIAFIVLAYNSYKQNKQTETIIYVGLALLFQPFLKIALGRHICNIIDLIIGIVLLLSIVIKSKKVE